MNKGQKITKETLDRPVSGQVSKPEKEVVSIRMKENLEYHPHPIDVSDVELDKELLGLTEAIAENAHEVWGWNRYNEGWRYGEKRNDDLKLHPGMVPYSELSEGEKQYDRALAMNAIRLVRKLGFNIERKHNASHLPEDKI